MEMKWQVKLPRGKYLWLKNNTPHEDLAKLGYDAYALTDARIIPKKNCPIKSTGLLHFEEART